MAARKRPPRLRTQKRQAVRVSEKLFRARDKLLDLGPGGQPSTPLDVPTAAVIEPRARSVTCPRCDEPFRVEGHEAVVDERAGRLREAKLHCGACGFSRSLWFRIVPAS